MGIEPTGRTVHARPDGFEDRGHHQVCRHFRVCFAPILSHLSGLGYLSKLPVEVRQPQDDRGLVEVVARRSCCT